MPQPPAAWNDTIALLDVEATHAFGDFVSKAAVLAATWLARKHWASHLRQMRCGGGIADLAAVFLVELGRPVGPQRDTWLWVVAGHVPTAHLVLDRASTAQLAMPLYADLVANWIDVVRAHGARSNVFPFLWSDDPRDVQHLAELLEAIRRIGTGTPAAPAWHTAAHLLREPTTPSSTACQLPRPGALVQDHRGNVAIAIAPAAAPSQSWLARQRDALVTATAATAGWWQLAPLSGGSMLHPATLLRVHGTPTPEQLEVALANANESGRRTIHSAVGGVPPPP